MKIYFSDNLPGEYGNNRRYLQDILEEYAAYSNGNIHFEFYRPDDDDKMKEDAQKSGIHPNRDNWRIAREIYIADTTSQARKDALQGVLKRDAHYFLKLLAHSGNLDLMKSNPDMSDSDINIEYIMNHIWIVGSPDLVTEKLMQLYYDVGGFGMLLAMAHEWNPRDKWVNSMNLLINEVMPKLNKMIK